MNIWKLHTTKPWTDTLDKNGVTLLETQLKVALPTRKVQKTLIKRISYHVYPNALSHNKHHPNTRK